MTFDPKSRDDTADTWAYSHQYKQSCSDDESLRARFTKQARWYAVKLGHFLPEKRDALILDVPCGEGRFLWFLEREGYVNAQGFDIDSGRIDTARRLGLNAKTGDGLEIIRCSSENSVDVIACIDFLEHLEKDQAIAHLLAMYNALKIGGVCLIRMPSADGIFGARDWANDVTHKWTATSGVLRGLLQSVGFQTPKILDERPVPYKLTNFVRLVIFYFARTLAEFFLLGLGLSAPRVWSTSMWAICRK